MKNQKDPSEIKYVEYILNFNTEILMKSLEEINTLNQQRLLKMNTELKAQTKRYIDILTKIIDKFDQVKKLQPLLKQKLEKYELPDRTKFIVKNFIPTELISLNQLDLMLENKQYVEIETQWKQFDAFYRAFKSQQYQNVKLHPSLFQLLQVYRIQMFCNQLLKQKLDNPHSKDLAVNDDQNEQKKQEEIINAIDDFFE